jgi:hypothetical protein
MRMEWARGFELQMGRRIFRLLSVENRAIADAPFCGGRSGEQLTITPKVFSQGRYPAAENPSNLAEATR